MTKHTPGPWRVMGAPTQGMGAEKPYEIAGGDYSALLATTCVLTGTNHARWESLANANLIADAPKLLKLVDDLTVFCVAQGWKGGAITAAQAMLVKHSGDGQ